MGRNRKRKGKAAAEGTAAQKQPSHKKASSAHQSAKKLSEQTQGKKKKNSKPQQPKVAPRPRVERPLPQLPDEIIESIIKMRLQVDVHQSWGRIKHMLRINRALNSFVRRYVRVQESGYAIFCQEDELRTVVIINNALSDVVHCKPDAKLFLQFQKALLRWWPLTRQPLTLYFHDYRSCPVLFEDHGGLDKMPVVQQFKDVARAEGDVESLINFHPKDADKIRKDGMLFIMFALRLFASCVRPGSTVHLLNSDRRKRSPHALFEALRIALEQRQQQAAFTFEQVDQADFYTDEGHPSVGTDESEENDDGDGDEYRTSLAIRYEVENASSEDNYFSNNHDPARFDRW